MLGVMQAERTDIKPSREEIHTATLGKATTSRSIARCWPTWKRRCRSI